MDVTRWLEDLGFGEYAAAFSENEIDAEMLAELTADDLKELGVSKLGQRKKILAAIAALAEPRTEKAQPPASGLAGLVEELPHVIAMPLHEYVAEDHPGMKLWAACDSVELLLRFLVTVGAVDLRRQGELDDKLLKQIWGKIEMPTLGAWLVMARSLAVAKPKATLVVPEVNAYVAEVLSPLLYGPKNPGTPETSFLALRNRLAHGGGMTRKEAERLIQIWQQPFEQAMEELRWMSTLRVVGLNDEKQPIELKGASGDMVTATELEVGQFTGDSDGIWIVRCKNTLPLWPMALFGHPQTSTAKGSTVTGEDNAAQVYVRKDVVRLQFTPLGVEGFGQSEAGETALESFQSLFSLNRADQEVIEKSFQIQDCIRELQRDANQMVGRIEEQTHIQNSFQDLEQGVVWLTGPAGMGKSFLIARLAVTLMETHAGSDTIVLPYRFKSGDNTRCNRDAFATFVIERLTAWGTLIEGTKQQEKGKAEEKLKTCLNSLARGKKVIFILDGLDELLARDPSFVEDIPLALRPPRIVWVCAGRPEPSLMEAFRIGQAIMPYPDGLPPMRVQDIRGMLLDKIGPLRKKLLAGDKEKGDDVVNPFIDLVARRAEGLPLYVKYVIGDVLSNRYRVLDGNEDLPDSLHAYHEQLIEGLGIGDLKAILTPLAATLALAYEPLAGHEIATFLTLRKVIPEGEIGTELISKGLAAMAPMLRRAPDPEGEEGFTLFHASLRQHILGTDTMRANVTTARQAFAEAAVQPDVEPGVANYLYRAGIDHLLDADKIDEARARLLDLKHLGQMFELGKANLDILGYWLRIGDDDPGSKYVTSVKSFSDRVLEETDLLMLRHVIDLFMFAGWYSAGVDSAEISVESHKQILGPEHPDTLMGLNNLAMLLMNKGDYDAAEPLSRQALETRERTLGPEHPDTLTSLNNLARLLQNKGDDAAAEPLYRQALETQDRTLGPEHPDTLTSLDSLATLLMDKGDYDAAEPLSRQVLETIERTLGPEHPDTLTSLNNLATLLMDKEDYDAAEPLSRQALETQDRTLGPEHPATLVSRDNLAMVLMNKGDYDAAEPLSRQVLETRERTLGLEHPASLTSLHNLATLLMDKGDYDAAEPLYRQTLETRERTVGPEHPATLTSLNNLATLLINKGDYDAAEPLSRQALETRERTLGPEHPATLTSLNNLARVLMDKGDYDAAEPLFRQALETRERTLGPEHSATLTSLNNLARLLMDKGDYDAAEPLYRQVLETLERTLGPEHPATLVSRDDLAMLLMNKGDYDAAEPLYRQTLEVEGRTLGPEHWDTLTSLNNLARLLMDKGDYDAAEPLFRQVLETLERTLGPEHSATLTSLNNLAMLLMNKGDYDAAEPLSRQALETRERTLGPEDPGILESVINLGVLLKNKGDYSDAAMLFQRGLEVQEHTLGMDHPTTLWIKENLTFCINEGTQPE